MRSANSLIICLLPCFAWGIISSPNLNELSDTIDDGWKNVPKDPDVGLSMTEIIESRGFKVETHYVTTSDGYILTMFRIPSANSSPPVLLQHGLLDSSYTWVSNYEDQSLGYILANSGFDVWFGNNRGNAYGRNHTTLSPDDKTSGFWDFSWDEMASLDVPALVNYVIDTTGYPSLGYVGHSEGTIQMFAAGSSAHLNTNADFQRALASINIFVALAPVAYVTNLRSKLLVALANTDLLPNLMAKGMVEFLPDGGVDSFAPEICRLVEKGCDVFLMTICGPSLHINASRIQVYVAKTPAGTSTVNLLHWMQGVLSPNFQKYDFGSTEANLAKYGQETPPLYDLSQMTLSTALFYGKNDYLADMTDVQRLMDELPSEKVVFTSYLDTYAHLDYTWAYDANVNVYAEVKQVLQKYQAGAAK